MDGLSVQFSSVQSVQFSQFSSVQFSFLATGLPVEVSHARKDAGAGLSTRSLPAPRWGRSAGAGRRRRWLALALGPLALALRFWRWRWLALALRTLALALGSWRWLWLALAQRDLALALGILALALADTGAGWRWRWLALSQPSRAPLCRG